MTTGPDTLALADSLMEAMGFKRVAIVKDNVVWPAAFEPYDDREDER